MGEVMSTGGMALSPRAPASQALGLSGATAGGAPGRAGGVAGGAMAPVEPQQAGELPTPVWLPQGWPARQRQQPHGWRSDGRQPPPASTAHDTGLRERGKAKEE